MFGKLLDWSFDLVVSLVAKRLAHQAEQWSGEPVEVPDFREPAKLLPAPAKVKAGK